MYKIGNWLWLAFLVAGAATRGFSQQVYLILALTLPPLSMLMSLYRSRIAALPKLALWVNGLFAAFYGFTAVLALSKDSASMQLTFAAFTLLSALNAVKAWQLGCATSAETQEAAMG